MTGGAVLSLLRERGWSIATCESLTGGLVAAALIEPAGASTVVRGGLVTYATDLKTSVAGVPQPVIRTYGVVSEEVALAMAEGARRTCGADVGVATTGVAGPDPVDSVPVGTVWLAVVTPGGHRTRRLRLPGDRSAVRFASVTECLVLITEALGTGLPQLLTDSGPAPSPGG